MSVNNLLVKNNLELNSKSINLGSSDNVVNVTSNDPSVSYDLILPENPAINEGDVLTVSDIMTGQTSWISPLTSSFTYYVNGDMGVAYVGADKDTQFSFFDDPAVPIPKPTLSEGFYRIEVKPHILKQSGGSNIFNGLYNIAAVGYVPLDPIPYKSALFSTNINSTVVDTVVFYVNVVDGVGPIDINWNNSTIDGAVYDNWSIPFFSIAITKLSNTQYAP